MPIPRAASIVADGTDWRPTITFRRIGKIEYRTSAMTVGFVPIPNGDAATTNFAFGGPDNRFCQIPRRPGTGRRRELSSVGSGLTWSGQSNRCSA